MQLTASKTVLHQAARGLLATDRRLDDLQLLILEAHLGLNTGPPEDGTQRALWHIARMVRDGGVAVGGRVMPDLMAPCGLAMKLHPQRLQSPGDVELSIRYRARDGGEILQREAKKALTAALADAGCQRRRFWRTAMSACSALFGR